MTHRPFPLKFYKEQNFELLKRQSLERRELFVDPEFPPNNKSLFFTHIDNSIFWKRPKELSHRPSLVVGGVNASDLNEGELGNTWFVSACVWLTRFPVLFTQVYFPRSSTSILQVLFSLAHIQ